MIRNRVEPRPLPKIRAEHLAGVFGEFDDVIDDLLVRLEKSDRRIDKEKARFFRYLRERVDSDKFGKMQDHFLSAEILDPTSNIAKYIDPTIWFESKLTLARRVGLAEKKPLHILDIGTGPAHFPVVAEFYGHSIVGTDLPARITGLGNRGHLYDALGDIYQVRRVPLKIEQFAPLPKFERRYDLVTAFLAAFNVDKKKQPWSIEAWNFFLNDLNKNVLTDKGELFMSLDDKKLSGEVWDHLAASAIFTNDTAKQVHIVDFSPFSDEKGQTQ